MSTRPRSAETLPVFAMLSPLMATPPAAQGEPVPSQIIPFLNTTSQFGVRGPETSATGIANRKNKIAARRKMRRMQAIVPVRVGRTLLSAALGVGVVLVFEFGFLTLRKEREGHEFNSCRLRRQSDGVHVSNYRITPRSESESPRNPKPACRKLALIIRRRQSRCPLRAHHGISAHVWSVEELAALLDQKPASGVA